ncbi:MAG: thioredoxin-dependent thiol peroxidase [Pseudomonadota bacterium]
MSNRLSEGDKAPAFSLPADGDRTISLADYSGKWLVLYFYPKDDTPGCTKEAIAFSADIEAFATEGAAIAGVSKDTPQKHDKFRDKHGLKVDLLSDESGEMLEAYGVWQEKKMYGKVYMGIARSTLLIDPEGTIRKIWPKVKVPGHAEDVLESLKALKG